MHTPPVAPVRPFEHTEHGQRRPDPYDWMRDTSSAALLTHLAAERRWYASSVAHLSSLTETPQAEMTARVSSTESSVSWARRETSYYTRYVSGSDYAQLMRESRCRMLVSPHKPQAEGGLDDESGGEPQVLLDPAELLDTSRYLELGLTLGQPGRAPARLLVRPGGRRGVPASVQGPVHRPGPARRAAAHLLRGRVERRVRGVLLRRARRRLPTSQVWRHRIGTQPGDDVLVLQEPDPRFELEVRGSRTGDLVLVTSASRDTTETWVVDAHRPDSAPRSVGGRRTGVEYHAEHLRLPDGDGRLLLVTNDGATEFRLVSAPVPGRTDGGPGQWQELVAEARTSGCCGWTPSRATWC